MNRIAIYLNKCLDGVAYSAPGILDEYSTDRSILKYYPRTVVLPENTMDLRRLVRFSYQLAGKKVHIPITMRGSGYSKTGADIGGGIIVSTERLNAIQEIDVRQRLVRVQCGVRLGELKKALNLCGLDLPVVGNPFETVGGLIAKAASASNNTEPSTICDFVERAEVVLSDGSLTEIRALSSRYFRRKKLEEGFEATIYDKVEKLIDEEGETIEKIPESRVNRFGYSGIADVKTKHSFSLLPLLCGSEGTLGIISEVILRVEPVFDTPDYVAIPCKLAANYVAICKVLKKLKFTDIVVYDTELFNTINTTGKSSRFFNNVADDGFLVVANVKDDSQRDRRRKLSRLRKILPDSIRIIREDESNARDFLELDCVLDAYLNDNTLGNYHLPLADGVYVPEENQTKFFESVDALAKKMDIKTAIFGSVDFNTFSIRPSFTSATPEGRKKIIGFLMEYLKIIHSVDGYPCGEAPEGRFMAIFARKFENEHTLDLYKNIKEIFDPRGILNPGIKHATDFRETLRHFRTDYNHGIERKD